MDYAPPPRSEPSTTNQIVVDATVSGDTSRRKPPPATHGGFAIGADKMFFLNRDGRFFLPQRPDLIRWNSDGSDGTPSGDASRRDEDDVEGDDDDDDLDDGEGEIDGLVSAENGNLKYRLDSSGSAQSSSGKCRDKMNSQEDQSSFGSSRGNEKDGDDNCHGSNDQREQVRAIQYVNAGVLAAPEMHYARILQGGDVVNVVQKDAECENANIVQSRRKDASCSVDFAESLRMHLSDPITGALMNDAMILVCGHSFGSAGMEHVTRLKACCTCGQPVSEDSIRPNLDLRLAVQAFLREQELLPSKASKRRRERSVQDKCNYDNSFPCDISRGKGVQFPFAVSDRVIIKGNKRTPPRFVGRVAVVTAQCLNGWYVVKTLDNAESVKLQYRSLEKAPDDPALDMVLRKATHHPNWL